MSRMVVTATARGLKMPDLVVSLQLRGSTEPWRAHLAAGVLLTPDRVLVPQPVAALLDPAVEFEVVVIPLPLVAGGVVERFAPARVDLVRVADDVLPRAAVVALAAPSRYPATVTGFDACRVRDAVVAHGGDLWSALESERMVPPGLRVGPGEAVLRDATDVERRQRSPVRDDHVFIDVNPWINWICNLTPICDPCHRP